MEDSATSSSCHFLSLPDNFRQHLAAEARWIFAFVFPDFRNLAEGR
jgi:hypothetical protein